MVRDAAWYLTTHDASRAGVDGWGKGPKAPPLGRRILWWRLGHRGLTRGRPLLSALVPKSSFVAAFPGRCLLCLPA